MHKNGSLAVTCAVAIMAIADKPLQVASGNAIPDYPWCGQKADKRGIEVEAKKGAIMRLIGPGGAAI